MSFHSKKHGGIQLFLCGDVMPARAIDQILPHPNKPVLYESYVKDARDYIRLAERINGSIPRKVDEHYIWGDVLAELEARCPEVKIINLETSVTSSDTPWPDKGIHYRLHPLNAGCLTSAKIDCCVLANNHVMDWGSQGLNETLETLKSKHLLFCGAGQNLCEAQAPAEIAIRGKGRVLVFAYGMASSGVPESWQACSDRPGINYLSDLTQASLNKVCEQITFHKQQGDLVVFSVHWGGNWGYEIPAEQRAFAQALIDEAGVDVVYGHSSHHVKGVEIYHGKPILYGCGDFLNDYEGIGHYEVYRGELGGMYFVRMCPEGGKLLELELVPTRIRKFQVQRASSGDSDWLLQTLLRECGKLNTQVTRSEDGVFKILAKTSV
ncbi:CapA family protein [Thiomicrorhabdus sp. zzn3]|uniref:CapA family protein n=1 Tax=Thiomicrorhabdus sp. zzn3 TaxID=3039775 RepID=UPI0024365849|nr:CapA family protein [Thiomicrorhabdus sp. zzn3]MDG6778188.1 CapA family protein [Thiomicrorhabdus sp. zzn3]